MSKNIENIVLDELTSESDDQAKSLVNRDIDLIGHVNVAVSVNVGNLDLSIEQLFSMKSGDVLSMNEGLNSPVTLFVNDKPVASGNLVAVDDNFGIQITEVMG